MWRVFGFEFVLFSVTSKSYCGSTDFWKSCLNNLFSCPRYLARISGRLDIFRAAYQAGIASSMNWRIDKKVGEVYPYHPLICRMSWVRQEAFVAVRIYCRQIDRRNRCQMDRRNCRQMDRRKCCQMNRRKCCQMDCFDQKILQEREIRRVCTGSNACVDLCKILHFTSEDGFCLSEIEICVCVWAKFENGWSIWTLISSLKTLAASTLRVRVNPPETVLTPPIILLSLFRITENNQSQLNRKCMAMCVYLKTS